jgi:methyl-accepting chemotaxis protein
MLRAGLVRFSASSREHAGQVDTARGRVDDLESFANDIFNSAAHVGVETRNSRYITYGLEGAAEVAGVVESALRASDITPDDLFDVAYEPIAGSDPIQFLNRFVAFADAHIRPVLDQQTGRDSAIVGCCLVDTNGFLPTHITERSQPQRAGERQWNLENARNRRIFMDNQTRRALDSEADFFLYSYRQDLGDGRYRPLRSVFVPLVFRGRRWGLYELGYLI